MFDKPRNTDSTVTSLEILTRKIVNQASSELVAYLVKLPECGKDPKPESAAADTRERILQLREAVERYLG